MNPCLTVGSRPNRLLRRMAALRVGRQALAAGAPVPAVVLQALACPSLASLAPVAAPCGRRGCLCAAVSVPEALAAPAHQLSLF